MTERLPTRRTALIGGAALLSGGAALAMTSRERDGDAYGARLATLVPLTLGPWHRRTGPEIILPDDVETADPFYDKTLSRTYAAPGRPDVMLVIAHGGAQSTSWNVHRPETCYDAAGFTLNAARDAAWPIGGGRSVPGRLVTMTRAQRVEQIGYWRRIADGFPATSGEERVLTLRRRLVGHAPDGVLVRMSVLTTDVALATATIAGFATALVHASAAEARRLMLGSLSASVA